MKDALKHTRNKEFNYSGGSALPTSTAFDVDCFKCELNECKKWWENSSHIPTYLTRWHISSLTTTEKKPNTFSHLFTVSGCVCCCSTEERQQAQKTSQRPSNSGFPLPSPASLSANCCWHFARVVSNQKRVKCIVTFCVLTIGGVVSKIPSSPLSPELLSVSLSVLSSFLNAANMTAAMKGQINPAQIPGCHSSSDSNDLSRSIRNPRDAG